MMHIIKKVTEKKSCPTATRKYSRKWKHGPTEITTIKTVWSIRVKIFGKLYVHDDKMKKI